VVDYLTKWAEVFAIPVQKAEVTKHVVRELFCRLGILQQLYSEIYYRPVVFEYV
jgi:hypothetical protein